VRPAKILIENFARATGKLNMAIIKILPKTLSYQSTYSLLGKLFVRPAKILIENFARATDKLGMTDNLMTIMSLSLFFLQSLLYQIYVFI